MVLASRPGGQVIQGIGSLRKLGLIGGMNWISTLTYMELIHRRVQRRATPRTTPPLVLESVNFGELEGLREGRDWEAAADMIIGAAQRLEQAGAKNLLICANAMHKYYDRISALWASRSSMRPIAWVHAWPVKGSPARR